MPRALKGASISAALMGEKELALKYWELLETRFPKITNYKLLNNNWRFTVSSDYNELVELAAEKFQEGNYQGCEPLLQQILLYGDHHPQVYQMLGTIYYDKGKFNQAIEFFQKALSLTRPRRKPTLVYL